MILEVGLGNRNKIIHKKWFEKRNKAQTISWKTRTENVSLAHANIGVAVSVDG